MDVTFETPQGQRFTVEIWFMSTVRRMKEYVHRQEGIPVESQRLFFEGRELLDDRDTEHYSILEGSHLLLVLPDDATKIRAAANVRVAVAALPPALGGVAGGGGVTIDVDASCTVARLKELILERAAADVGGGVAKVGAMVGKVEMEDDKTVAEYCALPAADGMEVSVFLKQPPLPAAAAAGNGNKKQQQQQKVAVQVKWGDKAAAVEVSDMQVVRELRAELGSAAPHLALPRDGGYFFIYKQNVMEEDRTLRWHDVKNGDTIEIFNGRVTAGA